MKPIVFLDVDGVLNDHKAHPRTLYCSIDRACAERLDRILLATGARIVLTSAWRYLVHSGSMTLDGLRNLLYTHWIDGSKLLGITRRDITDGIPGAEPITDRGTQIGEWLDANPGHGPYVVLDDMDLMISLFGHPFVQTDRAVGLTDEDAERAIEILTSLAGGEETIR